MNAISIYQKTTAAILAKPEYQDLIKEVHEAAELGNLNVLHHIKIDLNCIEDHLYSEYCSAYNSKANSYEVDRMAKDMKALGFKVELSERLHSKEISIEDRIIKRMFKKNEIITNRTQSEYIYYYNTIKLSWEDVLKDMMEQQKIIRADRVANGGSNSNDGIDAGDLLLGAAVLGVL